MAEFQHPDFPESFSRSDAFNILAGMAEEHSRFYDRALVRVHDPIHPIDHVIATVLKRSVALTQAFLHLWDQGNEFAAMPRSGCSWTASANIRLSSRGRFDAIDLTHGRGRRAFPQV